MIPASEFRPWNHSYYMGVAALLGGMTVSWSASLMGHPYIAAIVATWVTYRGCLLVTRGIHRENGAIVELRAIEEMRSILETQGYKIKTDILAKWIGNIDSVVKPPWTQASFVVEIKSFPGIIKRSYGLTKSDGYYSLIDTVNQVLKQCRYLGNGWHFPVLWMPVSNIDEYFIHKGILVVNGDVSLLERALSEFDQLIPLPTTISFPRTPSDECRGHVRDIGFKYNSKNWTWFGNISKKEFDGVKERIARERGRMVFLDCAINPTSRTGSSTA